MNTLPENFNDCSDNELESLYNSVRAEIVAFNEQSRKINMAISMRTYPQGNKACKK